MRKHILIVSQYFYPEQFRINDIAMEWVKRGNKVTVLTGIPNYPQGKFYKGYNWFKRRKEVWNGIEIIRIPLIPRGKRSIGMVFNYISFVISGFLWKCFTKVKADIVFTFEVSPMTQALIGVWYSKKHHVPNYLYVQDLWPENVEIVTGITNPFVIRPIERMVRYIYKNCDTIFATSPSFVKTIQARVENKKEKVVYWPQYAEDFYRPVDRQPLDEIPNDKTFKIIFTGNIGKAQGLEILPQAAKCLKDMGVMDVKFVIIGDGRQKDSLITQIKVLEVEDLFIIVGQQPPQRIPYFLAACDVAFISFAPNELFEKTIPAKLQSYMACGMPILAVASGETKRIVEESGCGFCCSNGDIETLINNILKMKKSKNLCTYSKLSIKYCEENFSKYVLLNDIQNRLEAERIDTVSSIK